MCQSSPAAKRIQLVCILVIAFCMCLPEVRAQQQVITTPDGKTIVVPAGGMPQNAEAARAAMEQMRQAGKRGGPPTGKPGEPPKKDGEKKPGEEAAGEKAESLENVKRTAEPPRAPDPEELKVTPDENGQISFQFRNQPWPTVLRWYAATCNLSFDWQELPGDYINLATQRPHSLEETGDMINRALLMRGFTMLEDEETLTVLKTEGLNPSLVPRVKPAELSTMPPHRFVRTSFTLNWLLAEEVHSEFASMISKNGKLTPLQSTNRIEAMDAAANLRDIHEIIEQEQSAIAMENLAREFVLQHARASFVKTQLEAFLGIQNSGGGGGGSMSSSAARMIQQQMQQMQQQMQQAARNAAKAGGGAAGAARKRSEDVYLVANERSNSVIVHAPPNKMALIESFIARVDVRNAASMDYQRMTTRMKVFRLASLGPTELVQTLTAMDVLEPATKLQVDEDNNAIIAYASVADQYLIKSVIERLDGSERSFQVIQLNRLDAESVAGSIKFLMGTDEEEDKSSSRNRYYGFYDPWGRSNRSEKKDDKMRVGANVQDNQLLLWVNEIEMEEVNNLLVKLGEIPPEGGRPSTIRVIDASRQPETYEYLLRLKEQWDKVSPNPLVIPDEAEFQPQNVSEDDETVEENDASGDSADESTDSSEQSDETEKIEAADDKITQLNRRDGWHEGITFIATQTTDGDSIAEEGDATADREGGPSNLEKAQDVPPPAPVKIFLDEGGNLVIQSDDTAALDRLERIMQANRPPKKPYDIFKVKHARASWVKLNLEEYFDESEDDGRPRFFSFFFDDMNQDKEDRQLGDRPPLRFIADNDTNSIVVQGADDLDRRTIKELIDLWDVPEPVDDSMMRYTRLVEIKYSRAQNIVDTIKEAYRDLLSANDKAFQQQGGEEGEGENKRGGGGRGVSGDGFSFGGLKGKLSLGPDALTNSILVSAEGKDLLELVCDVIQELDEAAQDAGAVEVYTLSAGMNGKSLEKALTAILQSSQQKQPNQQQKQQGNQPGGQPGGEAVQAAERAKFEAARGRRGR